MRTRSPVRVVSDPVDLNLTSKLRFLPSSKPTHGFTERATSLIIMLVSVTCHPLKIKSLSLALSCFCATLLEIKAVQKYHSQEELHNSFTELANVLSTYCSCPRRCKFSDTKYNNDDDNHRADNEN